MFSVHMHMNAYLLFIWEPPGLVFNSIFVNNIVSKSRLPSNFHTSRALHKCWTFYLLSTRDNGCQNTAYSRDYFQ